MTIEEIQTALEEQQTTIDSLGVSIDNLCVRVGNLENTCGEDVGIRVSNLKDDIRELQSQIERLERSAA